MDKTERFNTIRPKNVLLLKHIAYYYFQETFSEGFERTFTYYPNYRLALNFFKGSEISWDKNKRFTSPADSSQISSIVTFTSESSREVDMKGKINKIGIIFEPLGLNHFVDKALNNYVRDTITVFEDSTNEEIEIINKVFIEEDLIRKRDLLDQLFISRYQAFKQESVTEAIELILRNGGEITVQELAEHLDISRKTLLRLFNKHICCSVKGFLQLIKFRNALSTFKKKNGDIRLTDLAYQNQYYDQSSFIRHINAVTGINPSKLFLELDDFADENTVWTLKS